MIPTKDIYLLNRATPNAKPKVSFVSVDFNTGTWQALTSKHQGTLDPNLIKTFYGKKYINDTVSIYENKQLAYKSCTSEVKTFCLQDMFCNKNCVNIPTNIFLKQDKKCDTPFTCFKLQNVCPELDQEYVTIKQLKTAQAAIKQAVEKDVIHTLNLLYYFNKNNQENELR